MVRMLTLGVTAALVVTSLTLAVPAADASPTGPITNSEFELPPVTRTGETTLEDTALDECYGIGHQVRWGSSTPQHQATGGPFGEPDPSQADPGAAAASVLDDPERTAERQSGCFWNEEQGRDLAFVNPARAAMSPIGWRYDLRNTPVEFGYGFDGDVMDRETLIYADGSLSNRNLWQEIGPKHHAFTPNADALELRIEAGSIPDRAEIHLSLEPATPDSLTNEAIRECLLSFEGTQLQDALAASPSERLAVDPVQGDFDARQDTCDELEAAWHGASDDGRRDVLAQTRLTEVALWYWNHGQEPVVVDDLRLRGASLLAEGTAPSDP